MKLIWRKCYKNITNENYAKLISYLSKMKELDHIVLQKEQLCLTKGHLDNPERQVVFESPPNRKLFLIHSIYIKKNNFFTKRALLMKRPTPGCFFFMK